MAPRAIWKGAISFGMVVIPIKVFTATSTNDLSFSLLHNTCHSRLQQKRWCPVDEVEVAQKDTVRGYEYAKGQYVVMDPSDFERVAVTSTHTIEITRFVDLETVDPLYFEKSYALEPENLGVKPYYLLKRAMENAGLAAVAKVSLRQKESLCALRPYGPGMMMSTLLYADEVRGYSELNMPEEAVEITDAELGMANLLVEQMTGIFDPGEYKDEYRAALTEIIEARLNSTEPVTAVPVAAKGRVGDLMDALKASIEASKAQAPAGRNGSTDSIEESAPAKKARSTKRGKAAAKR